MTTMQGKRTTTPRGTEMLEFPRNRRGLRRNAMRLWKVLEGVERDFSSAVGNGDVVDGTRLYARRMRSMVVDPVQERVPSARERVARSRYASKPGLAAIRRCRLKVQWQRARSWMHAWPQRKLSGGRGTVRQQTMGGGDRVKSDSRRGHRTDGDMLRPAVRCW